MDPVEHINHLIVACKFCKAAVGEQCTLGKGRAHPSRVEDAAIALGFSEAEAADAVRMTLVYMVTRYRRETGPSGLDAQNLSFGEAPCAVCAAGDRECPEHGEAACPSPPSSEGTFSGEVANTPSEV